MGSKQLGFSDYEQSTAKKRTKRERFLSEIEAVVPWKALIELEDAVPMSCRHRHSVALVEELLCSDHFRDDRLGGVALALQGLLLAKPGRKGSSHQGWFVLRRLRQR